MRTYIALGYEKNLPIKEAQSVVQRHVETPELGPHDLLVEVEAVSVNPVDVKLRQSTPSEGFRVLGFDAAGTVRKVGTNVTLFSPGDEVFYAGALDRPGTNQQLHVVDERITGRKPRSLSFADSAALPLTAITAWESLFDRLQLTAESEGTLLVIGATGGVGSIMLGLAEALLPNVTVIATASSEERAEWTRNLGAEHVVNHREDLGAQVHAIEPDGVHWLFSAHTEGAVEAYAQIVRPFGHIVAIDDGPRDIAPLKSKCIAWHWEFMFARSLHNTPDMIEQHRLLGAVADLIDAGRIETTTATMLTPITRETLREAHALVESGRTAGKVVVVGWAEPA